MELRAHHVKEFLLFDYIRRNHLPQKWELDEKSFRLQGNILVTDDIDDICRKCRKYPEINFCRGQEIRNFDLFDARILGIEIGREYTRKEMLAIMRAKAEEMGMKTGIDYDHDELVPKFYMNAKKLPKYARMILEDAIEQMVIRRLKS